MREIQTEIQNNLERATEHFNGTVAAAGTPIEIETASARSLQLTIIQNPEKGANANQLNDILYVSFDGTNYLSLSRGTGIVWPGQGYGTDKNKLKIDASRDGVKYEVMVAT